MKSSILLTSALAMGVFALPKKVVTETDLVLETVVVTVTAPAVERQVRPPFASPLSSSSTQPRPRPTPSHILPPFAPAPGSPSPRVWPKPTPPQPPFKSPQVSQAPAPVRASPTPIRPPFWSSQVISSPSPIRASPTPVVPPFAASASSSPNAVSAAKASTSQLPPLQASAAPASTRSSTVSAVVASPPSSGSRPTGAAQAYLSSGPDYQNAILYHHNAARANHGAEPLTWDTTCEANARIVAENCTFAHYIPPGVREGQNLFTVSGDAFNVTAGITESWYKSELPPMMPYFGYTQVPDSVFHSVGHLTQLLWKGTTGVGCASVDCGDHMTVGSSTSSPLNKYTVCNYAPPGNVQNQYAINVQAPAQTTNLGSWSD